MAVLSFQSADGKVAIKASTAADTATCWRRFSARVGENASRYCDYRSSLAGSLAIALPSQSHSLTDAGEEAAMQWNDLPPVFYETAVYNVNIYLSDIEAEPRVVHKLKEVSNLFTAISVGDNKWVLTAPLSFLNEPGIFELSYRYKPVGMAERTDTFAFRVVSPKLDTKDDYLHILNDINREYNEIVFQYLTKTVQSLDKGGRTDNDVIWLSIFRSESRGTLGHDYFRHEATINTSDTAENRFVKFSLERISRRLAKVFDHIRSHGNEITDSELNTLDEYAIKLRKLSQSPLLRRLKAEPLRTESLVLQKRTGYAQVYRYWIMLQKGIELFNGSTHIGVRPIWELHELWCFLKMRWMVAKILSLHFGNNDEIVENPMPMIEPFTDNSQEHTVYYRKNEDEIRLHYQHTYNRTSGDVHTATTDNRPDIVLTIRKPDGFELTYLFDAKYRVCDDNEFSKEDKEEINALRAADYPPSDAINQMHRYRDAIYYGDKVENVRLHSAKEIIGGYILFPGRGDDEAVRNRYFFKSIETVNIGAFPLLPDHNDPDNEGSLLFEHLTKILVGQSAYEQIRDSIPQHGLSYARPDDLVLVGYYEKSMLREILSQRLYYVRTGTERGSINLVPGCEKAKYLLLHNGKDKLLLPLDGNGPRYFNAQTLREMGFSPTGFHYLGFSLKSDTPITTIDIADLPGGRQHTSPYFASIKELQRPHTPAKE